MKSFKEFLLESKINESPADLGHFDKPISNQNWKSLKTFWDNYKQNKISVEGTRLCYIESPFKPGLELFAYIVNNGYPIIGTRLIRKHIGQWYTSIELFKDQNINETGLTNELYFALSKHVAHYIISDSQLSSQSINIWKKYLSQGYARAYDNTSAKRIYDIESIFCKKCEHVSLVFNHNKTFNIEERTYCFDNVNTILEHIHKTRTSNLIPSQIISGLNN